MHLTHSHLSLALLIVQIFSAIANPLPRTLLATFEPHKSKLTSSQSKRGFLRVSGLPPGLSGRFTAVASIRPSLPAAAIFIKFFRTAASLAAKDKTPSRPTLRFSYGILVFEMISLQENLPVTKEFVHAATLWLLHAVQNGWTGFFEAWILDEVDHEMVYVRLATIWDLPEDFSNSPWD